MLSACLLVFWGIVEVRKYGKRRLVDSLFGIRDLRTISWQQLEELVGDLTMNGSGA